jgi:hypothetical protein
VMETYTSNEQGSTPASTVNFVQEGIKIGLLNGIFALLLIYVPYFMGMNTFVNVQFVANFLPYMIAVLLIKGFQLRKQNGGYLAFKEGLQFAFVSYVIAAILVAVGTYILYNVIDKDLTQKMFDITIEKTRTMMEKLNMPEDKIDEAIADAQSKKQETGLKNIILGTGLGLIWDFVKSILVTLIIRKEKPAF